MEIAARFPQAPTAIVKSIKGTEDQERSLRAGEESDDTQTAYRVAAFQTFLSGRISTFGDNVVKQSGSVNASVAGPRMSGTEGEIYNVFVAGTQTPVGTLSLTSSFTLIRQ